MSVIRDHVDPELRRAGPVQIDEPRTSREVDPVGSGRIIDLETLR